MTDSILPDGSYISIRRPKRVEWTPQEDITAYELARCLPLVAASNIQYPEDYIPKGCERHFKVTDQ